MHKHEDFFGLDRAQQRSLLSGGLDTVWVRPQVSPISTAAE